MAESPDTVSGRPAHDRADVLTVLRDVLSGYTDHPRLHTAPPDEISLQSLGIASVDMIGVVIELEERFGRAIDESHIHELRTLADLAAALEGSCALAS